MQHRHPHFHCCPLVLCLNDFLLKRNRDQLPWQIYVSVHKEWATCTLIFSVRTRLNLWLVQKSINFTCVNKNVAWCGLAHRASNILEMFSLQQRKKLKDGVKGVGTTPGSHGFHNYFFSRFPLLLLLEQICPVENNPNSCLVLSSLLKLF